MWCEDDICVCGHHRETHAHPWGCYADRCTCTEYIDREDTAPWDEEPDWFTAMMSDADQEMPWQSGQ